MNIQLLDDLPSKFGLSKIQTQMIRDIAEQKAAALVVFGVGEIEKEWRTATENSANLYAAYRAGYEAGRKDAIIALQAMKD